MRRILLLITDLELGGTPIVVRELATRLRSDSMELEVACLKPMGIVGEQIRERGVRVTSFEARSVFQLGQTVNSLAALVRGRNVDTVFSFLIHANFIASRAAKKLPGVRFLQSIQTTQPRPRWHWWLQKRIHHAAERIVVPSESVSRRIARWRIGDRLVIIPNAVDVDLSRSMSVPRMHDRDGHATFRIGFVGRLDPVKRIPDLIAAVARLPQNFRLDIYGDGDQRAQLVHAIETTVGLAGRVRVHGQITDPSAAHAAIDLLILPSEAEGFGLVLIEAMAAGVPVIGTNVDGIRDVIRDGETGILVPPRNPTAIAAAIRRMADDQSLRDRLVSNALIDVRRRFAWPSVLEQYRTLLNADPRV